MPHCPSCRRPLALARATCLYCGAPLSPRLVADVAARGADADAPREAPVAAAPSRVLLVLDLARATAEMLSSSLGLPAYEAALRARRGGLHLHRVLPETLAEEEAARLEASGFDVVRVPEAEARLRPVRALGGERSEGSLSLRTEEGDAVVRRDEVLLVVKGPITREYQASSRRRKVDTARLEEGYRLHLHRRSAARPLELDAANFEFGFAVTGSARLELDSWAEEVRGRAPCDDGFRRLPPALGPAGPEPKGALSALGSLVTRSRGESTSRHDRGDVPLVLDNVGQFRLYSGWRAAVERRREASR
jgi:hypothetical protein